MTEIPATSPPGAPGVPGAPAEHRLTVLSGHRPAHVALISVVAFGFLFNYVFFTSSVIEDHNVRVSSFRPKSNYYKHGYALSFLVTVNMSIVEKPKNYSPENIRRTL